MKEDTGENRILGIVDISFQKFISAGNKQKNKHGININLKVKPEEKKT